MNVLQPTIVHMVPPLVTFLGHNNDWDKKAFHRTHTMPCGAAPLGAAATTKLLERIDRPDFLIQNGNFQAKRFRFFSGFEFKIQNNLYIYIYISSIAISLLGSIYLH